MSESIKAMMAAQIEAAKKLKAEFQIVQMDYKHAMKKLTILAEAHPEIAAELGVVIDKKDEKKPAEG